MSFVTLLLSHGGLTEGYMYSDCGCLQFPWAILFWFRVFVDAQFLPFILCRFGASTVQKNAVNGGRLTVKVLLFYLHHLTALKVYLLYSDLHTMEQKCILFSLVIVFMRLEVAF